MSFNINKVVFDCDSTLTAIEGIDFLAKQSDHYSEICTMTNLAMANGIFDTNVYLNRLNLINVTADDLALLASAYLMNITPGAKQVINELQTSGIECFVMSAGLEAPVVEFAMKIGIKKQNIFAVRYNPEQKRITKNVKLTNLNGKDEMISMMQGNVAIVGDGANDLADSAKLRIGFGGQVIRSELIDKFDVYIYENNLLKILPYILCFDAR